MVRHMGTKMNELEPRKGRGRGSAKGTRVDEAYLRILSLITDGRLMGGERLPSEDDLATAIGVSRPVIRQALSRLQYGGIVKVRWGAGTFVQDAARAASTRALARTPDPPGSPAGRRWP